MKNFLIMLGSFLIVSCSFDKKNETNEQSQIQTQQVRQMQIATSFYPIEFLVKNIAPKNTKVINISKNQDLHNFSLSANLLREINQSQIIFLLDKNLETQISALENNNDKKIVFVELNKELNNLIHLKENSSHHDHGHSHNHSSLQYDPHTWLLAQNLEQMSKKIAKELIKISKNDKQEIIENKNNLLAKLKIIRKKYDNKLKNCQKNSILISHNSFAYLEEKYDFKSYSVLLATKQDKPSANKIADLKNIAKEKNLKYILQEENNVQNYADLLKKEADLELLKIRIMETTSNFTLLESLDLNLETLSIALEC